MHGMTTKVALLSLHTTSLHLLQAAAFLCVPGCYGYIAEKAEAHGRIACRMVTWRPDQTECLGSLAICA